MHDKDTDTFCRDSVHVGHLMLLGEVMAEAVHEINNLMMAVSGYAEVGLSLGSRSESAANLEKIVECARQVSKLTRNLLRFAKPPASGSSGDVAKAVETVLELFRHRTKKGIRIVWKPDSPLPSVALATGDLQLVLANLVKNALDVVEDSPSAVIRLTAEKDEEKLTLGVWNSGPPIPLDILPRVFTPFFTTKSRDGGTGLGLSVAHRIVSQAGGEIKAVNPESGGALFVFSLPLAPRSVKAPPSVPHAAAPRLDGRRVLVVDDEEIIRDVMELLVGRMGGAYVETCSSGEEALRLLRGKAFDAVLLDLLMPGLSGQEVYGGLPEPLQKHVVFVTGDTGNLTTKQFLATTGQPVLFKPVDRDELLQAVLSVASA